LHTVHKKIYAHGDYSLSAVHICTSSNLVYSKYTVIYRLIIPLFLILINAYYCSMLRSKKEILCEDDTKNRFRRYKKNNPDCRAAFFEFNFVPSMKMIRKISIRRETLQLPQYGKWYLWFFFLKDENDQRTERMFPVIYSFQFVIFPFSRILQECSMTDTTAIVRRNKKEIFQFLQNIYSVRIIKGKYKVSNIIINEKTCKRWRITQKYFNSWSNHLHKKKIEYKNNHSSIIVTETINLYGIFLPCVFFHRDDFKKSVQQKMYNRV